ncbi:MAG: condensation domain-containing protein, partial [Chloroflexi bacterium]|nr:condensation domain-containing protein [Chloroflexota bacterium]
EAGGPEAGLREAVAAPAIGRPVDNVQVYLLDAALQPVPVGVAGELTIGGESLARGYWGRPGLTAERFIPNPFSAEPGGRLYQTGDLARWRPDGEIEFLGRDDEQVKVRGYRIELGEVEITIGQHPHIREVVALVREDTPGDRRLVAYVVAREGEALTAEALRAFLSEKLPGYMIPAAFTMLEALPLTPNGKVDRRALPVPDYGQAQPEAPVAPPRTPTEKLLAEVWSQVLGQEEIGIHDNFFLLGGDSILTIRVVARANQAGLRLTPKQLFDHQTIAKLAAVVDAAPAAHGEQGLVTGPVPLTPIQRWFFEQELSEPHHYNQAVLLETKQELDAQWLAQAFEHILEHHDALRLRFVRDGLAWRQFNAAVGAPFSLAQIDLAGLPTEEQRRRIEEVAAGVQASLDLSAGPLLRAVLFNLGRHRPGRLLIVIHHLAVDTVSWSILLEDLARAYEQLRQGRPVQLPLKTTSFKAWVDRLTAYAQSDALGQELPYWLSNLDPSPACLPVDFPEGIEANREASAETVTVWLSAEETKLLLRDAPRAYQTQTNELLLAALTQALNRQTGQRRLRLDLEGHGREDLFDGVDISRTVGWFTTIFPVSLETPDPTSPDQTIKAVKEQLRRIPARGLGYGLLRSLSQNESISHKLKQLPVADVLFNYLGHFDQNLAISDLFGLAQEAAGPMRSLRGQRPYLLEVVGSLVNGRLRMDWIYSQDVHRRTTIEGLAQAFVEALQGLIAFCLSPAAGGYTPADFPLARLSQSQLDQLAAASPHMEDIYPLTPAQQGMFFHALYQPESEVYFGQSNLVLSSALDVAAFKQAWQQVVARHPILRTSFVWEGVDEALQVVHREVALPWKQEDWRGLPAGSREARWKADLEADRKRGFDLSQAPVMRLALIRVSDEAYYFAWSTHHVVLDGWSLSVLLREVFATYEALAKGQVADLGRAYPYRDYVAWLQRQEPAGSETFWREALRGFSEPTPLPIGQRVSPNGERHFAEERTRLPAPATASLKALAQSHEVTLNTLFQGIWAILLGHYSHQDDVVFGCTVSGRPVDLAGVESIVGPFISVLPMRAQLPAGGSFWHWLAGIQRYQVEMRQHEYTSLARIQRWSQVAPQRPLFESMLVFESATMFDPAQLGFDGRRAKLADAFVRNNFPFTVKVVPWQELEIHILYQAGRFEVATIDHVLAQFRVVLEYLVARPEAGVAELRQALEESEQQFRAARERKSEASSLKKLRQVRRKAVHKAQP